MLAHLLVNANANPQKTKRSHGCHHELCHRTIIPRKLPVYPDDTHSVLSHVDSLVPMLIPDKLFNLSIVFRTPRRHGAIHVRDRGRLFLVVLLLLVLSQHLADGGDILGY